MIFHFTIFISISVSYFLLFEEGDSVFPFIPHFFLWIFLDIFLTISAPLAAMKIEDTQCVLDKWIHRYQNASWHSPPSVLQYSCSEPHHLSSGSWRRPSAGHPSPLILVGLFSTQQPVTWNIKQMCQTDIENRFMDMGRREERVRCMGRVTWKLTLPCVK